MTLLWQSILAVVLAAIAAGIIGTLAVANRMVSIGGGLAHAAYGGIGLAFLLGWAPLPVTIAFTLGAGLLMNWLVGRAPEKADTLVGVVWALGMAFGILCVDLSRAYASDLMAILFGSLIAIPRSDLIALAGLDVVLLAAVFLFRRPLLALALDAEFAEVSGFPVKFFRAALLSAIAVAVVLLLRVTGLVLLVAYLSIPGALALRWSKGLGSAIAIAICLGVAFGAVGLAASWWWDLSTGASIIAVAGITYLVASVTGKRI